MNTPRVSVTPSVLQWAARRTGLDDDELLKRFPKFDSWLEGDAQPTLRQAQKLAHQAKIPFGRLLLKEPSGEDTGVADFRIVRNSALGSMSPDLQEVVLKSQQRLAWYSDYAKDEGIEPPVFFASASSSQRPQDVALSIREHLGFDAEAPFPGADKVRALVLSMEEAGVLVARNSIVESSTKRRLSVDEFRGFTIEDDGFCLVFINTRDAKTAQLFSLAHELGHVVLGKPGVSDHTDGVQLERWCNQFASELIAPASAVQKLFDDTMPTKDQVERLARRFGLSREAMLWRLDELELIDQEEARRVLPLVKHTGERAERTGEGAPPHHVLVRSRVGGRFFDTVTQAAVNGQISQREAARYLGSNSSESFANLVNARQVRGREAV
ncbi:hypothetical protein HMPREF2690_03130 [Corynebacterium sp. HMSC034E11]|uniref:ImmA/IrrE family metallo-endopeptidase n=1 Tax=Corynebacterium sp. HMSC034E11 TaxID=1715169 RepID=UPI0008AA1787|nr:ImmA/IrrE family metallo-endopeptidase [Corynebacterium sp. HMSC034E11]OHO34705.1 hypothetical protein HMPREF2690_03130 [Corynebacterium sp. HMSC034E11]